MDDGMERMSLATMNSERGGIRWMALNSYLEARELAAKLEEGLSHIGNSIGHWHDITKTNTRL
jgi:hypothetical protein